MEHWIDDLARAAAGGLSRREALRRLGAGLAGGLLAALAPGPIRAQPGGCTADETQCGRRCVNLQTDVRNCGACGNVCPAGASCQAGVCIGGQPRTCPAGETLCGPRCVNLQADVLNCGACGSACPAGATCQSGACVGDAGGGCPTGQVRCPSGCVDLMTDEGNCGACGNVCGQPNDNFISDCVNGVCVAL